MKYAGWLLDAGTEHERAIAGAGYAPSMGAITAEPLVLLSDAAAEIYRLRAALLDTARRVETLKQPCGTDPETHQALRNGKYMSIVLAARAALGPNADLSGRTRSA